MAAACAAVLAGVLAAGAGYGVGARREPAGPFEAVAVRAAATGVDASAGLVPHTWGVEIKLTATGFAAGGVYRVTVLDRGGRAVSAGEFVGTGSAPMRCNLSSSVLRADATSFRVADAGGRTVLTSDF